MIRIDTRAGSKELIYPLRIAGVAVEEAILPAGDVEILGNGLTPTLVGIEYKTVQDATTCMRDGRFSDQLRRMRDYFNVNWLVIEGVTREAEGQLEVRRAGKWFRLPGRITYQEFASWTLTMAQAGGVLLWRTADREETVKWVRSQYLWWTKKDWEQHRAHLSYYEPPVGGPSPAPPTLAHRVAHVLPHLGETKSLAAAQHFKSVVAMVNAEAAEWEKVEGVGKKIATAVYSALRREG